MILSRLISETQPLVFITPTVIFKIGNLNITNSMIYGWSCSLLITILLIRAIKRSSLLPGRSFSEMVMAIGEFIRQLLATSLEDEKLAAKYAPTFMTIFFFILFSNWLGMIPGVGEALTWHGAPLLRPITADLNATLAASVVTLTLVQFYTLKETGPKRFIRHYFAGKLYNPLTYLAGVFEIFNESTRVISLALRLFLNVAIGEIIITVFSWLGHLAAPLTALPFFILEMLVGALQAYIFVLLAVMYMSIVINKAREDESQVAYQPMAGEAA